MRADRAASLYFFGPLARVLPRRQGVPILMYHRVPPVDQCATHPYYCTNTAAPVFEQQIRFLKESGYRTVNITKAFESVQGPPFDEKLVAITFDDGYLDFYTHAFPILSRYGFTASVFLPTAYIGDSAVRFKGIDCLTWGQVRELRRAGMEFGSHTVTHPRLSEVGSEQLLREVADSKCEIEQRIGEAATSFAYPYAFPETNREFVRKVRAALVESGYREGVSTVLGRITKACDPLFMKRLPVNSHDDPSFFRAKLEGGYDWLRSVQYAAKLRFHGGKRSYKRYA
jgi:peptidoglycan/xylan/chitin deacetylase (PgdA/CDA1 family)